MTLYFQLAIDRDGIQDDNKSFGHTAQVEHQFSIYTERATF